MEILLLKKRGLTQRQIARKLGISRNTLRDRLDRYRLGQE